MSSTGGKGPSNISVVAQDGAFDWKKYHEGMSHKMVLERLREAIGRRERGMLERAIDEATAAGLSKRHEDMERAHSLIRLIDHKKKLREAVASNKVENIWQEIKAITKSRSLMYSMQRDVQEAERYAEGLERLLKLSRSILDMDKRTISEVRRYHTPPRIVHRVIQAALLLLGEDELSTSDWRVCQGLMNPSGPNGLNKKIVDYDVTKTHPEIVARARDMLNEYTLNQVQPVSKGVATFHVWATATIDTFSRQNSTSAKAANQERQREILGKPLRHRSPVPNRKTYSSLATPRYNQHGHRLNHHKSVDA